MKEAKEKPRKWSLSCVQRTGTWQASSNTTLSATSVQNCTAILSGIQWAWRIRQSAATTPLNGGRWSRLTSLRYFGRVQHCATIVLIPRGMLLWFSVPVLRYLPVSTVIIHTLPTAKSVGISGGCPMTSVTSSVTVMMLILTNLYIGKFAVSNRVWDNWNCLPEHIVMSTSLNIFKNKLDHHLRENLGLK